MKLLRYSRNRDSYKRPDYGLSNEAEGLIRVVD